ncbi:MFS transporter [Streptacidiphilus sp. MAP5-3]|uniref:MFS transporter n=1 Tax=unclassified Streptacidiphilus TaxID=2643834 RepID=UPI0035189BC1
MEAPPPDLGRSTSLWRNRAFLFLWGGQSVSVLGSTVSGIIIPLYAVLVLHVSTFEMGLLAAAGSVPYMLVGLMAGAVVDRFPRRRLMFWCDLTRALALASIPLTMLLSGTPPIGQLLAVAVLVGVMTVFFDVAYQSYLPGLVENEQLIDGNGKLSTTESVAEAVGPGLAGVLITVLGRAGAILFDVATYALSCLSLVLIRTPDEVIEKRAVPTPRQLVRDVAEGAGYVARDRILRRLAQFAVTVNLFGSAYGSLEIVFLNRDLHAQAWMIGAAAAIGSTGGVLGGLAAAALGRRIGSARATWLPLLALGWLVLLVPLAQPGWGFVLVGLGTAGNVASIVIYATGAVSYRQATCPPHLLSRVTSCQRWISWCSMPAGALFGGLLGTLAGLRAGISIAVVGCFLAGLWLYFSPLRGMRDLPLARTGTENAGETLEEQLEPSLAT